MSLATRTAHAQRRFLHLGMGNTAPPFFKQKLQISIIFRNLICFTNFIDSIRYTFKKISFLFYYTSFILSISKKKHPLQLKSNKLKKQMSYINNEQICIYQNIFNLMKDGI